MSIERYLQAPLEDEAASVPAINAALKQQGSRTPKDRSREQRQPGHSRGTSYDANSEGRRTFYTSASGQDSTGTSISVGIKTNHRLVSNAMSKINHLPKLRTAALEHADIHSPEEPATGRTGDSERTLIEGHTTSQVVIAVDDAYRARIENELAALQHRARRLEQQMRNFSKQDENDGLLVPRITDELAYEQMESRPKLAWLLGGLSTGIESTARVPEPALNQNRPSTSGRLEEETRPRIPQRSKSSSALQYNAHNPIESQKASMIDRTPSKRHKFFCTFCQKKFHNRVSELYFTV